jgi:hypothetical protein
MCTILSILHNYTFRLIYFNIIILYLKVPSGNSPSSNITALFPSFVDTDYQNAVLSDLALSHSVADICIIGPRGSGKTAIVNRFATTFHYNVETVSLYQVWVITEIVLNYFLIIYL